MGIASILVIVGGVALTVLFLLAARSLFRRELGGPAEQKKLDPETAAEEEALAQEALAEPRASVPAGAEPSKPSTPAPAPESNQEAYRRGLTKTRAGFMARLNGLLFGRAIDPSLVDELEELLVTSDIGIKTATRLLGELREKLSRKEIQDGEAVRAALLAKVTEILSAEAPPLDFGKKPLVIMVIGVNGVGKTTTIGKLAARFSAEGKKVVLAAGDTFRAAAVEQLEVWAQRSGAEVVKGKDGSDPASVAFEAVEMARRIEADVCIADTAGRLHTKVNLMEELKKVRRVIDKAMPGAPHEVLLVLDATTGQNGIAQAEQFASAAEVGSIVLTKLDGTAKGGMVVAIADQLKLPVRYIGVGEKVDDLRDFQPTAFAAALFQREDGGQG
ncbi:MAG: signal recognition particle-docking protein FtsY [Myxococcota bacterium]